MRRRKLLEKILKKEHENKKERAFSGEMQCDCWELRVTAWEAVKEGAAEGV